MTFEISFIPPASEKETKTPEDSEKEKRKVPTEVDTKLRNVLIAVKLIPKELELY